jgi:putative colanic acid biosynthesis UDP-glucose lipid carrier transferase
MVERSPSIGELQQLKATPMVAPVAANQTKRVLDFLIAVALVLLLLPLLAGLAAFIMCDSPGPALFRQRRTGLNGRVFTIYKFRTMTVLEDDLELRHAVQGDGRVTRLGRFLRRSSLDELPQLFNILKGDMSLVGPRPHAVGHDCKYALLIPEYWARFQARPGLTGLAQVAGLRGEINGSDAMVHRVEQDLRYIREWSLGLDVVIALRTLPLLLKATNAY